MKSFDATEIPVLTSKLLTWPHCEMRHSDFGVQEYPWSSKSAQAKGDTLSAEYNLVY